MGKVNNSRDRSKDLIGKIAFKFHTMYTILNKLYHSNIGIVDDGVLSLMTCK
jgi:hypothetical protein